MAVLPIRRAAILDSRTVQSTPTSGARAGYDGAKRKRGSKVHLAVDTLGHLLALQVTPADAQDRDQVGQLAEAVQAVTHAQVELAYVDQGYTGEAPAEAAQSHGMILEVVKLRRPSAALPFCLGVGSSSAALPGWRASGDWHAITSACPKPLPACTTSPLPASCFPVSPMHSTSFITCSSQHIERYARYA